MLDLLKLEQLKHIIEWDVFVIDILIPLCDKQRWHVDYEFLEDRCCVIGHFDQDKPEVWLRFIDELITPYCQQRGWQVEPMLEEDAVILIHRPTGIEKSEPEADIHNSTFSIYIHPTPIKTATTSTNVNEM